MSTRTIFKTALTEVSSSRKDPLGAIRYESGKVYKYVKYVTVAVAGNACKYLADAGYVASEVSATSTSQIILGAGICVATAALDQFGWIQIRGRAVLSAAATGSPTANDGVALSGTAAALAKAVTLVARYGIWVDVSGKVIAANFPE